MALFHKTFIKLKDYEHIKKHFDSSHFNIFLYKFLSNNEFNCASTFFNLC